MVSTGINKLIEDAKKAGCMVYKYNGRFEITKPNRKSVTLIICPDGTAYRGDIDLTIAKTVRTQKQMREILGLKNQYSGKSE